MSNIDCNANVTTIDDDPMSPDAENTSQLLLIQQLQNDILIQNTKIEKLTCSIFERDELLVNLENRVRNLERDVTKLEATGFVKDRVCEELKFQLTKTQQHSRRPNVTIVGIDKERGETHEKLKEKVEKLITDIDCSINMSNVDKFHRDGPVVDESEQNIILRFKSHDAKKVFLQRWSGKTSRFEDQPHQNQTQFVPGTEVTSRFSH